MTGPAPFFSAKGDESDATLIKAAKLMGGEGRQRWTREKNEGIPANTFLKDVITAPLEYLRSDSYDISTQQIGYSMRTEMQENTWARLRESCAWQGVSHAT